MVEVNALNKSIHLWTANLNQLNEASEMVLDEHERHAAHRIRIPERKYNYIKSRWLLRQILSLYVMESAQHIQIVYHEKGKPYLRDHPVFFNVSHSHDQWIVALTVRQEIGVDIERIRPLSGMEAMVRKYFHMEDQIKLQALNGEQKTASFYQFWTAKEAFVKMHGLGLFAQMNSIRESEDCLMFEGNSKSIAQSRTWRIHPEYMTSVAVIGTMKPIKHMDWILDPMHIQKGTI